MLRNYLVIALRVLRKQKLYAALNVFGLAVGIASCLLIFLFVRDELSYDRFHEHADRIYRVVDRGGTSLSTSALLAPTLEREFARVERAVRIYRRLGDVLVTHRGESRYEDRFFFTDSTFFEVFSFPLLRGNPRAALTRPFTLVISEDVARRYFGDEDPIGQTLNLNDPSDPHTYEITGVARNAPHNSHFKFDFLASFNTRYHVQLPETIDSWTYVADYTYVLIRDGEDVEALQAALPEFYARHQSWRFRDGERPDPSDTYTLQAITAIHLHSHLDRELEVGGDVRYLYVFSVVALLILLIAGINYTNLATARSAHRACEVGIRKVVGARRGQLTRQFLSESVVLTAAALALALVLVWLALPAFNRLTGKPLSLSLGGDGFLWLAVLGIGVLVAVVAGLYPALFLSGFQPARVLRGTARRGGSNARFRSGLVVAQFAASVALIVGTITVQRQLDFMQDKRLGLNPEQIVELSTHDALGWSYEAFKGELLASPHIRHVTASVGVPPMTPQHLIPLWTANPRESDDAQAANAFMVGVDFPETLEIPIVAGRSFRTGDLDELRSGELMPVIVNQAAVEAFGWQDPLGMELPCCFTSTARVIGVIEDFHYQSLKMAIAPLALIPFDRARSVLIRVQTQDLRATLDFIEDRWRAFAPGFPFEYGFLDEHFAQVYGAEERLAQVFGVFALLAILLACLGLFGLAAFAAERRTKEIGIRKVLGASVTAVVTLLSKDFLKLVLLGILVAVPVAYLAMHRWLEDFAYRVDVSWLSILAAGLAALVIALATVSYHAVRAASVDPVQSLRYE